MYDTWAVQQDVALAWAVPALFETTIDEAYLLWAGSVRSGKTTGTCRAQVWHALSKPGVDKMIVGKSTETAERNVVKPLQDYAKSRSLPSHYRKGDRVLELGGVDWHVFGAYTKDAQDKIQGMTASGGILDEAPLFPMTVVQQAMARCSVDDAKLAMTFNKTGPFTQFKKMVWDKAKDIGAICLESELDDNPGLSEEVKERFRNQHHGHYHKRFIENKWAAATGLIWPVWSDMKAPTGPAQRVWAGVDWGTSTATTAIRFELHDGRWYATGEYFWDPEETGHQRGPAEHAKAIRALGAERYIVDPSAAALRLALAKSGCRVSRGKNDVEAGVQTTDERLRDASLVIDSDKCPRLAEAIDGYVWDEKAQERGEDKPLKQNDHGPDGTRYFVSRAFPPVHGMAPRPKGTRL